ncbi:hypothetical protein BH10ACI4_BH10ACI4_22010 [soil metagenome]
MKKYVTLALLALCLGVVPASAFADTLTLVSTGGQTVNGVQIYPYNFSVNGASTLTALLCLNYNREVSVGETWNVTKSSIALDNSQTSINYRALAIIDYDISTGHGGYSASDLQFADWSIFAPSDMAHNSGYTSTAASIVQNALQLASNDAYTHSGFYSAFTIYTPTSNQTGWTNGIPPEFMGYTAPTTSPVPEPSTLMMLGTGLIGAAGAMRRKFSGATLRR